MINLSRIARTLGSGLVLVALFWLFQQSQVVNLPLLPEQPTVAIPVLKSVLANYDDTTLVDKTDGKNPIFPTIFAPIGLAYAVDSETTLYEKNPTMAWAPASTTKLMTALVALENYSPNTLIQVLPGDFISGEKSDFDLGEEILVQQLLEAMLVASSNQAAYILANHAAGGYARFIERMNSLSGELGLTETTFSNPAGFDADGQQTTARDLVTLAAVVMANPNLREIVSLSQVEVSDFNGQAQHNFQTTNQLLIDEAKVIGIKTGTTDAAGQVLLSQFQLDNEDIVVVVMGSQDRYLDTRTIVKWVLDNYDWLKVEQLLQLVE